MGKDIRGTHVARVMEDYCDSLAKGNRGDSDIEKLYLEGTTLSYKVKIRHWHQIKTFFGRVTVYSLTTWAEGKVDVLNPDPDDVKFCVKSPVGDVCATLTDVIRIIAGMV